LRVEFEIRTEEIIREEILPKVYCKELFWVLGVAYAIDILFGVLVYLFKISVSDKAMRLPGLPL
jgi:hypothetical protein